MASPNHSDDSLLVVKHENDKINSLFAYRVKKVEPKKLLTLEDFANGDKVKVLNPNIIAGKIAEVVGHATPYVITRYYGKRYYFFTHEIELHNEKETAVTFKTGDRIEFVEKHDGKAFPGDTAVVTADQAPYNGWGNPAVKYKLDKDGKTGECFVRRVKLVPEFTLKDVEVGDTIRRTLTLSDGSTVTKEGVVVRLDGGYASGNRITLALPSDTNNERVKLELINRPEKPKHWAHTKPVGALAVLRPTDRVLAATLTKTGKDEWVHNYVSNNNSRKYTNEQLAKTIYGTSEDLNWLN